jgi:hypothetical protein
VKNKTPEAVFASGVTVCELEFSWFINRSLNRRSAVPRHPEIRDELVRKICRDLGVDPPEHT